MSCHEDARDGLWTTTDDPERWPGIYFYDTRDEAEAMAESHHTHVGQVVTLKDDEIVDAFLRDPEEASEQIWIQDEWSWLEEEVFHVPDEPVWLELRELVRAWVKRHSLNSDRWYVIGEPILDRDDKEATDA